MAVNGYRAVKKTVLQCIKNKNFQHEQRGSINEKNLLSTGEITEDYLFELIKSSNGTCYQKSQHHILKSVDVHIIKHNDWYVKYYFLEIEEIKTVFISVHK